jgi:hypothetical protein
MNPDKVVMIDECLYFDGIRPAPEGYEVEVELPMEELTKMFTVPAETVVMDAGGNMVEIKEEEEEEEEEEEMEKVD